MASQLRNQETTVGIVNEENWREVIRKNYVVLARIKTEHFVDELYEKCAINKDDKDEIDSYSTPRRKATFLLDLLQCKGFTNFIVFLGILEIEYPDAFRKITEKDPVRKPGRHPRDRTTVLMTVMPAMLEKLHAEMKQNESLAESLHHVEQTIEILKEEKTELEIEVERYRIELKDLPQLREKLELLTNNNEDLRKENGECTNRCSEYIREKELVERRYRELKIKTHELQRQVELTNMQKENEKRETQKWESICKKLEKGNSVDDEVEILRERERELADKNETLAVDLWNTREILTQAEEELRKSLHDLKKCQEAKANSDENLENLEQRCEDTRFQVDRLRSEKDNAIKSQQLYFDMYQLLSHERDSLSCQLRSQERRYDSTKKQLDKLKQDMRSSLNSEKKNLCSSINQWIGQLDSSSAFGSGSSSDESNTSSGIAENTRVPNQLSRSDTVSPVVDEPVSYDIAKHRRLLEQYDMVYPCQDPCRFQIRNGRDTGSEALLSSGSEDGAYQDFYVRCEQDSSDNTDGQLPYSAGDILLITNSNYDNKRDLWLAERVDPETGVQLSPEGHHKGVVKATKDKDEKPVEKKKNVPSDSSEKTSTINRQGAMRKIRSQEKNLCLLTPVTCVKVLYKRPVVILGPVSLNNIVTAMVSSNTNKYESWFNHKMNEIEAQLVLLKEQTSHVMLPPCSLKLCHDARIYPICIYLNVLTEDNNEDYLMSVFESGEETEQQNSINYLSELRNSGIIYSTFEITPALVPRKDVLVKKLIRLVDQLQDSVLWLPSDKCANHSDQ